jgi:hypothetical protein
MAQRLAIPYVGPQISLCSSAQPQITTFQRLRRALCCTSTEPLWQPCFGGLHRCLHQIASATWQTTDVTSTTYTYMPNVTPAAGDAPVCHRDFMQESRRRFSGNHRICQLVTGAGCQTVVPPRVRIVPRLSPHPPSVVAVRQHSTMVPRPWFIARQDYQMASVTHERTGAGFTIKVDFLTRFPRSLATIGVCENHLAFPSS